MKLSVDLSICLWTEAICYSIYLSMKLIFNLSMCLLSYLLFILSVSEANVYLSMCLWRYLLIFLSVFEAICWSFYLSLKQQNILIFLSVPEAICYSVHLSVNLSVWLYRISLSLSLSLSPCSVYRLHRHCK